MATTDVEVSIKLTAKETGKLYMNFLERGKRIRKLEEGLRKIISFAEDTENRMVADAAKDALAKEPKLVEEKVDE
jgi:hypothetical protein